MVSAHHFDEFDRDPKLKAHVFKKINDPELQRVLSKQVEIERAYDDLDIEEGKTCLVRKVSPVRKRRNTKDVALPQKILKQIDAIVEKQVRQMLPQNERPMSVTRVPKGERKLPIKVDPATRANALTMWEKRKKVSKQLREQYVANAKQAMGEAQEEEKMQTSDKVLENQQAFDQWRRRKLEASVKKRFDHQIAQEKGEREKRVKALNSEVKFGEWLRRVNQEKLNKRARDMETQAMKE